MILIIVIRFHFLYLIIYLRYSPPSADEKGEKTFETDQIKTLLYLPISC